MDGYLGDEKGYEPVDRPGPWSWWKSIFVSPAARQQTSLYSDPAE